MMMVMLMVLMVMAVMVMMMVMVTTFLLSSPSSASFLPSSGKGDGCRGWKRVESISV